MTTDKVAQPEFERPIDLTDTPGSDDSAAPAPTPEHHPGAEPAEDRPGPLADPSRE